MGDLELISYSTQFIIGVIILMGGMMGTLCLVVTFLQPIALWQFAYALPFGIIGGVIMMRAIIKNMEIENR